MGSAVNILTEHVDFLMYTTDFEYIIEFTEEPVISKESLKCSNGVEIAPEAYIKKLHGRKTSAGFSRIDCDDGWSFRYLGKLEVILCDRTKEKNIIVLFDVFQDGEKVNKPRQKENLFDSGIKYYYPCYIFMGNMVDEKSGEKRSNLFYSSRSNSGRVVETDIVELLKGEAAWG